MELMLVIGIIGALASIVIVAINPTKQLCDAENAKRNVTQREMTNALFQYIISQSDLPPNVPTTAETAKQICRAGVATGDTCVNLDVLVPDYVAALPIDESETDATLTGYKVYANVGRPTVIAVHYGVCGGTTVAANNASASSQASAGGDGGNDGGGSTVGFRMRPTMMVLVSGK